MATLGDATPQFERPAAVAIAGHQIFVFDVAVARFWAFDLRTRGRQLTPTSIAGDTGNWGPRLGNAIPYDGGIAVLDLSHKQIVVVDGAHPPRDITVPPVRGAVAYAIARDDQGRLVVASRVLSPGVDQAVGSTIFSRLHESEWTPLFTLAPAAGPPMTISLGGPRPLWAFGPDGTLGTSTDAGCGLEIRDSSGSVVRVLQQIRPSLPVSAADRDLIRRSFEARLRALGGNAAGPLVGAAMAVRVPDKYPAYVRLLSDDRHRFWMQRPVGAEILAATRSAQLDSLDFGSEQWDVWDAQGHNLFGISFPAPFELMAVSGDLLAGVTRDPTGRPVVAVYEAGLPPSRRPKSP